MSKELTVKPAAFVDFETMLIGGESCSGSAGSYLVVNPSTEEVIGNAPEASAADVAGAIAAAREALPGWSGLTPTERASFLKSIGAEVRLQRQTLAPMVSAETGCLLETAFSVVERSAHRFELFAQLAAALPRRSLPPERHGATMSAGEVLRKAVGVVACITPFNFPLIGVASKVGPALAMGNTVVFKPAPQDPLEVLAFGSLCRAVGLPPGVVNVVTGSGVNVGRDLVASSDVDMVSFTGSTSAGVEIYRSGAASMRRMLLELGGKGALIVRQDADLDAAAQALARVWTYYSGQWCAAPTRAIVHRHVYDGLIDRLVRLGAGLKLGDPADPDTSMGPVISAVQRQRINAAVAEALRGGAEDLLSGVRSEIPDRGFFVRPSLIVRVNLGMPIVRNETFGPVLSVLPFDEDDEAIALANDTEFGLTNYVFSRDTALAWKLAEQLNSGAVLINTATPRDDMPFGGRRMSGIGRDGGLFALDSYSEAQGIAVTA